MSDPATEIRKAAAVLVDAFGRGDLETYLGCFSPDATFLFHTTDRLLTSVEAYRSEWDSWVREDDFRVLGCETTGTHVQVFGDAAVLTHEVRTTVSTATGSARLHERETIVFRRTGDGRWLAVHEHLSPHPAAVGG